MSSIQKPHSQIIIENNSQVSIKAILRDIKTPDIIVNIVVDVVMLASVIRNIKFV